VLPNVTTVSLNVRLEPKVTESGVGSGNQCKSGVLLS